MSGHGGSRDGSGRKRKPEALPVVSKSNPWTIAGGSTSALNDNVGAISAGGSAERTAGGAGEGAGDSSERAASGAVSDTERAGRNMTLSKILMRSSLADKTFAMLVWVSFNSPPAHQLDMSLFVREWKVNGHKGALHTQEWEDAERRVLARLRSVRKATFLGIQDV